MEIRVKTVILILHLVSGAVLEITNQDDVKAISRQLSVHPSRFKRVWGNWMSHTTGGSGEYCCIINGEITHINFSNVEYIVEKEIPVGIDDEVEKHRISRSK